MFNWYGNNGDSSYNISTGNSGLEFPKGSGKFADLRGRRRVGRIPQGAQSIPKVGGSAYRYALQAGHGDRVRRTGRDRASAVCTTRRLAKYRVYRVRPDVTPTTKFADVQTAMHEEATADQPRTLP